MRVEGGGGDDAGCGGVEACELPKTLGLVDEEVCEISLSGPDMCTFGSSNGGINNGEQLV